MGFKLNKGSLKDAFSRFAGGMIVHLDNFSAKIDEAFTLDIPKKEKQENLVPLTKRQERFVKAGYNEKDVRNPKTWEKILEDNRKSLARKKAREAEKAARIKAENDAYRLKQWNGQAPSTKRTFN